MSPRPRRVDHDRRSYSLPTVLLDDLDALADELDMNPSILVRRALEAYLPVILDRLTAAGLVPATVAAMTTEPTQEPTPPDPAPAPADEPTTTTVDPDAPADDDAANGDADTAGRAEE